MTRDAFVFLLVIIAIYFFVLALCSVFDALFNYSNLSFLVVCGLASVAALMYARSLDPTGAGLRRMRAKVESLSLQNMARTTKATSPNFARVWPTDYVPPAVPPASDPRNALSSNPKKHTSEFPSSTCSSVLETDFNKKPQPAPPTVVAEPDDHYASSNGGGFWSAFF